MPRIIVEIKWDDPTYHLTPDQIKAILDDHMQATFSVRTFGIALETPTDTTYASTKKGDSQ